MEQYEVAVKSREEKGKGPVGRLRRQGWVPAVIYGHGKPAEALSVERRGLHRFISTGHHVAQLKQEADGGIRRALLREVQVQPVTQEVLHVDFVEISEHERVEISVRLVFRGDPIGVRDGGVFSIVMHEIQIACAADAAVDELHVDVSGLELGHGLHVRELSLPDKVEAVTDGDQVVATVKLPRGEVADEEEGVEDGPTQPEVISEQKREEREKEKGAD